MRNRRQTFLLAASRPHVESACRRALRNVDWLELPTGTWTGPVRVQAGAAGGLAGELIVLTLIEILKRIPPLRQRLTRLITITLHAPTPAPGSASVIYAIWGNLVMVTISLRGQVDSATEVTIEGKGGLVGTAAAAVTDLRQSIAIESGSLTRGGDG